MYTAHNHKCNKCNSNTTFDYYDVKEERVLMVNHVRGVVEVDVVDVMV